MSLPRTPSLRLDGRRALVTGAGRGIGLAAAAALEPLVVVSLFLSGNKSGSRQSWTPMRKLSSEVCREPALVEASPPFLEALSRLSLIILSFSSLQSSTSTQSRWPLLGGRLLPVDALLVPPQLKRRESQPRRLR